MENVPSVLLPSLIQSNFGDAPGNLEVMVGFYDLNAGLEVMHYWRESAPTFNWSAGDVAENVNAI